MPMKINRTYAFTIIPEWVLYHPDADDNGVRVYGALHRFGEGEVWPSLRLLSERLGKSQDTVRRGIRNLEAIGAVTVEQCFDADGRQTSNTYLLAGDEPLTLPTALRDSATHPLRDSATQDPRESATQKRVRSNESKKEREIAADAAPLPGLNGDAPERTPGQRAHALMQQMYDGITERTGKKPVSIKPVAMVKLLTPFMEQYSDDEVRCALRALWKAGRPITQPTIEAEIQGRRPQRGGRDVDRALAELRDAVDESGNWRD
jgi:hypothetical protein